MPRGNVDYVDNTGIAGLPVQVALTQTQEQVMGQTMTPHNRGITDEEFFHLTCHVEPNLKQKIERGEFVDLEKLLMKDKFKNSNNAGQRMELVSRVGETFIMPVDSGSKITNVRKWEQAFRIYAAIYSHANPHCSAVIWQYVFVINSAASTYTWENVSNYDFMFRQLMACNLAQSWANIYLQMWNLTMRDPIPRFNNDNGMCKDGKKTERKKNIVLLVVQ